MIQPDLLTHATYWTILALLCIGFATSTARAATQDEIKEEFAIGHGGALIVDVDDGNVEVTTHEDERVSVQVLRTARADGADTEREILEAHEVRIERDGEQVRVWARMKESYRQHQWNNHNHNHNLSLRFIISIPRRFAADLTSSDGHIAVQDLLGDLTARSSDGDITLEGVRGELNIKSSDGDLVLRACAGTLKADTSDGDIDVSFAAAPDGDCRLQTSDGNVMVKISKDMALSVDGKTGDGRIQSDLSIIGETSKRHLRGDINGGGPTLTLRTSDGDIALSEK